jgi:hypothetical protein
MPYTIPSEPPNKQDSQKRSRWARLFDECREHQGEWRRIIDPLRKTTAAQIASDIRNAHTRDLDKTRLRGFEEGDHWEAVWGHDPEDDNPDNFYIWLKFLGRTEDHHESEDTPTSD